MDYYMGKSVLKICILLLLLFTQLSYSVGEKYTSIIVSKQVNEQNGTIFFNITVLYFNTSRIEIPQGPGKSPKIVEETNITSIENATVYISFYNTSYTEEGKLVQTLVPLPCSPLMTNETYEEDGKVVYYGICIVSGELYSKYFNNTCKGFDFYFPGIALPNESIPPTETTLDVCTGKPTIFEALRGILASAINPEDPFCISMFIIFGLLLATMFFTGRSPLALLDMVTPMLPRARRFAYRAGEAGIGAGHKQMREAANKAIKAVDKEIKEKEKKNPVPANLRSSYNSAPGWKKLLVLKALEEGNVGLAERILTSRSPFDVATDHWGEKDRDVKKAYTYYDMKKTLEAYDEMLKVPKPLKPLGKVWLLSQIPLAAANVGMMVRFVKRAVKAPFVRYGELKRVRAVESAPLGTPARMAAEAELAAYRRRHEIKPVQQLFDPLVFGQERYKVLKEQVSKELISYLLLRVFDKAKIEKKEIERIFALLQKAIAEKNEALAKKACADLDRLIHEIDNLDPRYKHIIETIRRAYLMPSPDPYLKASGILLILEKQNIISGRELSELKKYIQELRYIDRMKDAEDIQKFLMAAEYITDYRADLLHPQRRQKWEWFVPSLFTSEVERKKIPIFSMLFAHELLSQAKADISDIARYFFGIRGINPLFPLMEYNLLPATFKGWVKKENLDGVYKTISSFSSRMFDEIAKRHNLDIPGLMKEKHVGSKFVLLTKGVFDTINLNTKGDWHVFAPDYYVGKTQRITSSAFGRALESAYVGAVKERFESAFNDKAFINLFSYYSVITKNFAADNPYQLASIGYNSVRYYVAKKLGVDVDDLTDDMFKRFIINKKNLDLYLTDFDKGSFVLLKGYGVIPFIQDVLRPDPSKLDRYFVDKKIREYIENRLGYSILRDKDAIYSKLVAKGGIALSDSFINTTIIVNVDGKFRLWKGQELSEYDLYKLDKKLVEKKEKIGPQGEEARPGDFVKLYQLAASGDTNAFNKVKEILIKCERMDAFMPLASAYYMSTRDVVSRQEIFKGITQNYVRYIPMEEARNVVQDWKDRVELLVKRGISGAFKPIIYAGVPYWEAMGTVVTASEAARRIGVEYVGGLTQDYIKGLGEEERKREMEFAKAVKEFEHAWQWTITRDALLYGGFERYGRPGYLTTGFHVGPAMPITNWMDRRSFSPLFQNIPILDWVMQNVALTTFKLSVAFSRPFVLGARAITFRRFRYPSVYDLRSDISEINPFVATQGYYSIHSTIPLLQQPSQLLYGAASLAALPLVIPAFIRELRERRELPIFSIEELTPEEEAVPHGGEGARGIRLRKYVIRGRVVEAIRNSIARAHEMWVSQPGSIRWFGVANLDIFIGAPRMTDTYWFYSSAIANIGDTDTNPGLSYIQSYTGEYVWESVVPRALERKGFELLPRMREHMFDVHEKRTLSALGMAAFYYTEIHWADPFNFRNNPLYSILSPGTALLSSGGWMGRKIYRWKYKREIKKEEEEYRKLHPGGPVTDWDRLKMGGPKSSNAILNFVKGKWERWVYVGWSKCNLCGTNYYGSGPCPRCGAKHP
ncbi:MAG: hypothetical protein QXY61_00465 [Candidatus Anstonellales archaeon]